MICSFNLRILCVILNTELEAFLLMLEFIPLVSTNHCLNFLMKQLALILFYSFKYFNTNKCPFEICGNITLPALQLKKKGSLPKTIYCIASWGL